MMGEQLGRQDRLFYEFCLDDRVPADHLVRRLDAVLDLSWLRDDLAPYYSHTGCPSVDPELMIRMMLLGYCYSIRSDRRLCQEIDMNLAYRWFCRLGLEDRVPDHSTFSVNRHGRFRDSDVLRRVFESVVRGCMNAGLVGGEGFAVDASVIEADASRFRRVQGSEIDWSDDARARRPIREYLEALDGEQSPTNPEREPPAFAGAGSGAVADRPVRRVDDARSPKGNVRLQLERPDRFQGRRYCRRGGDADADLQGGRRHRDHGRSYRGPLRSQARPHRR